MTLMSTNAPKLVAVTFAALALSACAVGPDYKGPPKVAALGSTTEFVRAPAAVQPSTPAHARWWTALNDPLLDRLIDKTLHANPSLAEASAHLRAARARLSAERAKSGPNGRVTATEVAAAIPSNTVSAVTRTPSNGGTTHFDLYSAGFDATWELDLFGARKRAEQSAAAQVGGVAAQVDDVKVSLAAETADAYIALGAAREHLERLQNEERLTRAALDFSLQRRAAGATMDAEVESARRDLLSLQASMASERAQAAAALDALAVLTGQAPGALDAELASVRNAPETPATTSVGDVQSLISHRPDVRAAEHAYAGKVADVGSAVADFYPKVTLMGDLSIGGTRVQSLTNAGDAVGLGAPMLQWNILSLGQLEAGLRGAKAERDAAAAHYQGAVLGALQDANDSLARFGEARRAAADLGQLEASAHRDCDQMKERTALGAASRRDLISAERQCLHARGQASDARVQLLRSWVALQKSLGLGWS
jgi:NodT family efflux transporter outer membrane factor (OMF) lipoprotein